ncbi:helix-turn-helix domain-containing protein [Pseudonocardia sp. TRM90224]|uniref:helix-turn-helix domain-containing protein n=1 Tax=Pseudonocardia sp. TRM90224 TaxID=2812678 RepID=UPI001E2A54D0|nr:helix-turn-helix domain-containing protein [Pseudonocardia sp. TRM90224]
MVGVVGQEAARRSFLATGRTPAGPRAVADAVVASWERSRANDVDAERLRACFRGDGGGEVDGAALVERCAQGVFAEFLAANVGVGCSLALLDPLGMVRARHDDDPALGDLLDGLLLLPGYGYAEGDVGTTAAAVALHEQADATVRGPEHYNVQLLSVDEAAAVVRDPETGATSGVVVVVVHASQGSTLQLAIARTLVARIEARMAGTTGRLAVLERFREAERDGGWVIATDGDCVLTNAAARHLDAQDLRFLSDLILAGAVLRDFTFKHVDLPVAGCCEVALTAIRDHDTVAGCLLTGAPASTSRPTAAAEAVRRQGSHVAPTTRRDYAEDLRHGGRSREHIEASIRANRELLTPFLRAQEEVLASITQGRNHLLIGEPGVGKRTLVTSRFRQVHPSGRLVTVDCASYAGDPAETRIDRAGRLFDRPTIVVLHAMNTLSPLGARRLDEALRLLVTMPSPPLLVGCVDTPAVDATRPYGLLLRHFHEVTRIPALRYRADEIGEIALSILRRLARGRLRVSHQVIRVLEGYAWPGNISELEDVLRYVVARKPLGEIQAPDLPAHCFQRRPRRMSMLEAAQCDAIIQALYEARGNRYKAASMLGIARSSLYRKIDAFGISYIA